MKLESTSNKFRSFLKGHFAPFFVVAFFSISLMYLIVLLVYRDKLFVINPKKDTLLSILYVIPFTAIQCAFEELFFRYSLLLIFRKIEYKKSIKFFIGVLIAFCFSIVFAFLHFTNGFLMRFFPLLFYYFAVGFYFSLLAIRFNSIVLPFSLHFFNNLYTFVFVTVGEALSIFHPYFRLDVDPNNLMFLTLNFLPLVVFTEIFLFLLKFFATHSKTDI